MESILQEKIENRNKLFNSIDRNFKRLQINKLLRQSNFVKEKGFLVSLIFRSIFLLAFSGKNLYRTTISNEKLLFGKDAVYRFLNSQKYNWRKFLFLLNSSLIHKILSPLTSNERVNVLIVDDSFYDRNRSKNVELLSRVRDHSDGKYKKGFRMLTLGWSDGNSFLPLTFSLLSSEKDKNRYCGISKKIDKRTNGYKLRLESMKRSTEVLLDLVKRAKEYKIPAKYILFDSWFAFPLTIGKLFREGFHTIAMLKAMPTVLYKYNGKFYNLNNLYYTLRKRRGRAKLLATAVVELKVKDSKEKSIKAKIIFVRDKNNSKKWLALISTDTKMEDTEIIRLYGKRWDIEVFFKMSKSYLNLAKEFQSRSYDALVAHTTIVFTRYIILALINREEIDDKTIGNMFYQCCDELKDITFLESLSLILKAVIIEIKKSVKKSNILIERIRDIICKDVIKKMGISQIAMKCES